MLSDSQPPPPVRTILVVGASGLLGSMVARRLLAAGNKVRALGRDPARLLALREQGAEAVLADLSDRSALAAACRGADQVFTSAHGFVSPHRTGSRDTDLVGNNNLVQAAAEQGVRQFVFTSVYINDEMTAIDFMAHKRATEESLRASGLSHTILRPTVFMDTWAWLVGGAILQDRPLRVYGDGRNPVNFVAASDVAEVASVALARATPGREVIDIGGPEDLSQLQVIELFERALNRKASVRRVPATFLRLASLLTRAIQPALSRELATGYFMAKSPQGLSAASINPRYTLPMTRFEQWISQQWLPGLSGSQPAMRSGDAAL